MNASKLTTTIVTSAVMALGGLVSNIAPSYAAPSPSRGMVCPAGFNGETHATNSFRCVKRVEVLIGNICTNRNFPQINYRVGRDVCSVNNVNIPAVGELTGLNPGRDFVPSKADPEARKRAEQQLEQGFTAGRLAVPNPSKRSSIVLPVIAAAEREAIFVGQELKIDDNGTLDDHTLVKFDVFVFPVKRQ